MDPQVVLEWLAAIQSFVGTYGNLVLAYVEELATLLIRLFAEVPGWLVAAWKFLKGIVAIVRSIGGF